MKFVVLQAPLKERLIAYLKHLGVDVNPDVLGQFNRLRNDLAHARPAEREKVIATELELRHLAREVMKRECARRGITFAPIATEGAGLDGS